MNAPSTLPSRAGRAVLLLSVLLVSAASLSVWGYTVDDAWITFRYARNAADGLGVVYNPGQRVEGFTSPAWFVLSFVAEMLRIPPDQASKFVSLLMVSALMILMWRRIVRGSGSAAAPMLILALHSPLLVGVVCGLEAAAAASLVGCLLILASEETVAWRMLAGVGCAAICTRPESVVLLAALGLYLLAARRAERGRTIMMGAIWIATFVVLTAARRLYFGQWVPNTAVAKIRAESSAALAAWYYIKSWAVHYWWLVALAVPALFHSRSRRTAIIGGVLIAAQLVFVVIAGGDWMPQWRFMLPVDLALVIIACAGAAAWCESSRVAQRVVILATLLGLAGQLWMLRTDRWRIDYARRDLAALTDGPIHYIAERVGPGDCIAARDIGVLGYSARCDILDLVGLTDARIAKGSGFRQRDRIDRDYVFGRRPLFLIFQSEKSDDGPPSLDRLSRELVKDVRFGDYRLVRRFEMPGRHFCEIYERRGGVAVVESSEPRP